MLKNLTLCLAIIAAINAEENRLGYHTSRAIVADRGVGILDAGSVGTSILSNGNLIKMGGDFPEGCYQGYMYIANLGLMVGIPGKDEAGNIYPWALRPDPETDSLVYWGPTVSESWFDRTDGNLCTDWEAADGANGAIFSGNTTVSEIYGGMWNIGFSDSTALFATSTLESTWPLNSNNIPTWPGWTNDDGDYFSDEDVYLEFDDRFATRDIDSTQGYPTDIKVKMLASSYADQPLQNTILYRARLLNMSAYDYERLYVGLYFDADIYSRRSSGSYTGRSNDDDLMDIDADDGLVYVYDRDDNSNGVHNLAYVGLICLNYPEGLGLTGVRWIDWYKRPGVYDAETNTNCCSGDGIKPEAEDKEAIQYALLSNDIDYPNQPISDWEWRGVNAGSNPRQDEYNDWYFHPNPDSMSDPNFDSVDALIQNYPDGMDCLLFATSGPYDINAGDSIEIWFAVVFGDSAEELISTAQYLNSTLSTVNNEVKQPVDFQLLQNYPNPFNPQTTIEYTIGSPGRATLSVYNIQGQLVETLVDGFQSKGKKTITWDAGSYSSGIYFYRLFFNNHAVTNKMLLVK